MKLFQLVVGAAALTAAVIHSGCSTATEPTDASYWELGSATDEHLSVTVIYKGSTAASVREILGEPTAIKKSKQDPAVEEWIYDRNVHYGVEMKGMNVGTGRVTAYQKQRLREIAEIHIRDGAVERVKVTRIRNEDGLDPIHR